MEKKKLEQGRRANSQLTSGPQNFDYNVTVDETENNKPALKCIGVLNPPLKVVSSAEATTPSCSRTSAAAPSCSKTTLRTSTNAQNNLIPVVKYQHRMPYRLVTQKAVPPTDQGPNRAFIMSNQVVNVHSNPYAKTSYQNQTTCSDQQNPARNFTQVPRETPDTAKAPGGTPTGVLKNFYSARRDAKRYETNQNGTQNPFTMTNAENIPEPYGSPKKRKSIKIFKKILTALGTGGGGDSTKKMTPSSSVSNFLELDMLAKEIEVLESLYDQSLTVLIGNVMDLTNKMHGDYLTAQLEEYLGVKRYNEIAEHGITPKYYEFLAERRHADKEIFSHPMDSSSVTRINQDDNATYGRANFLTVDADMAQKIPNITVYSVEAFDKVEKDEEKNKGPSFVSYQADAASTAPLANPGSICNRSNQPSSSTSLTKLKDTVGISGPVKVKNFASMTDARSAEDQKKEADIYISRKIGHPTADVFEKIFNFKNFDPSLEKIFESPEADMNREWFEEKCRLRKILQGDGIEANEMQHAELSGSKPDKSTEEATCKSSASPKSSVTIADDADDCVLVHIESGPDTENLFQSKSSNVYNVTPCISAKVSVGTSGSKRRNWRELGACKQKIVGISSEPNSDNRTIVRAPLQQKENIKSLTFNVAKKRPNCRPPTDSSEFITVGSSSFPSPNISKNINSGFSKPIFPDDGKNFPTSNDIDAANALVFMSRKFSLGENHKALSKKMSLPEVNIELEKTGYSVIGKARLRQKKGEFDTVKYVKNKPREECKDEYVKKTLPDVKNVDDIETEASPAGNTSDLFKNKYGSIVRNVISHLKKSSNLNDTVRMEGNRSHDNRKLTSPQNVHENSDPLGDVKNGEDNECFFVGTDEHIVGIPLSRKSGEIRQPSLVKKRNETLRKEIFELIATNVRTYSHLKILVDVINYDLEDEDFDDSTLDCIVNWKEYYLMTIYNKIVNRNLEAFSSEEVRNMEIAYDQVLMAIGRARYQNSKKDVAGQAVASTNQFITPDDAKEDKCGGEIHGVLFENPQSEQVTLLKPEKTCSKAGKSIFRSLPDTIFENTKTVKEEAAFSKHVAFSDEIRKSRLDRDRHIEDETIPGERPPSPKMVIVKSEPLDSPEMQRTYPCTCCRKRKARDRTPSTEDELPVSKKPPWVLRKHTVAERTPPSRKKKNEVSFRTPDSQCTYSLRSRINGSKSLSGNHT